jgi:hypothetical protein
VRGRGPRLYEHSDATVKIVSSNQTLILAGESTGRRGTADTLLEQASRLVAGGAELKRVTILAARPDSTVVVQADYFSSDEDPSHDSQLPAVQQTAAVARSSNPSPMQLYARTQHGIEDTEALLDVFV